MKKLIYIFAMLLGCSLAFAGDDSPSLLRHSANLQAHFNDNISVTFGNTAAAPDARIFWNTTQTVDGWYFGAATAQNTMIIAENGDAAYDFAHGAQTNPTLFIQSAAQSATEFSKLTAGGLSFGLGIAVTAGEYSVGRDADATNQLHFNVPTGAGYEWSINDVAMITYASGSFSLTNLNTTGSNYFITTNLNAGVGVQAGFQAATDAGNFYFGNSSVANTSFGGAGFVYTNAARPFQIWTNNVKRFEVSGSAAAGGNFTFTQGVNTSGSPTAFKFTSGAHTGLTSATEDIGIDFDLDTTKTWANGAITTQREFVVRAPTYDMTSVDAGNIITSAATFAVTGAPIDAGGNIAITSAYSIWSQSGMARFDNAAAVSMFLDSPSVDTNFTDLITGGALQIVNTNQTNNNYTGLGFGDGFGSGTAAIFSQITNHGSNYGSLALFTRGAFGIGARYIIDQNGNHSFTQPVNTSGVPTLFTITPGAHTGLTATTEVSQFKLSATTQTWAAGNITTQRYATFGAPTYTITGGASTITNAINADFADPVAGALTTLTNIYAIKTGNAWLNGGQTAKVTTVAAATYNLLETDYILNVTYTGTGAVTNLQLMTEQTVAGRVIRIKDAGGNAGTNNITITTEGAQTIDGAATLILNTNYQAVDLYCDGSNWFIL